MMEFIDFIGANPSRGEESKMDFGTGAVDSMA